MLSAPAAQAAFPGADGVIVISTTRIPAGWHCSAHHRGAQLVAVDPGSPSILLTCQPGSAVHPFVSPDGTEVVFAVDSGLGSTQLFSVPLDLTPTGHHVTPPVPASASPSLRDDDPSWSPAEDGTIVFQRWAPGAHMQLYEENVTDPAGAHPVFTTPTGFDDTQPVFDPADAHLLAFVRRVGGHTHILTYDLQTHVLTDLSAGAGSGSHADDAKPDFSPDGTEIAFESDRVCRSMQLYVMSAQGGTRRPSSPPPITAATGRRAAAPPRPTPPTPPKATPCPSTTPRRAVPRCQRSPSAPAPGATGSPHTIATGDEPSWGPTTAADPPADAPETSLPVALPVLGAAIAGSGLWVRHRRARRTARCARRTGRRARSVPPVRRDRDTAPVRATVTKSSLFALGCSPYRGAAGLVVTHHWRPQ